MATETYVERAFLAEIAKGESNRLDFKSGFNPQQTGDWRELIKDIVSMADSGGGRIAIGLRDDGTPSDEGVVAFLSLDLADIANKIYKHTDHHFADFSVE